MNSQMLKGNKGISLIEVLVVVAVIGILFTVTFSLLAYGNKSLRTTSLQYDVQREVRFAMDTIIDEVRYATKVEIISIDEAKDHTEHQEEYSYLYLDSGKLYHIKYDKASNLHKNIVHQGNFDNNLSLFSKRDNTTLSIRIVSEYGGKSYNASTDINLVNLRKSGKTIIGSSDLALRYIAK